MRHPSDPERPKHSTAGERLQRPVLLQRLQDLERLRNGIDHSLDLIFLAEAPDGRVVDVNDSFCRHLQSSRAEILGRSVYDISDLQDNQPAVRLLENRRPGGNDNLRTACALRRRDGSLLPVEVTLARLSYQQTDYVIAVARDCGGHRRSEPFPPGGLELAALGAEIGKALTMSASMDETLQRCAQLLVRHTGAVAGRIWAIDPRDPRTLELRGDAGRGAHSEGPFDRRTIGDPLIAKIVAGAPHTAPAAADFAEANWLSAAEIGGYAGHPLRIEERLIGVVELLYTSPLDTAILAAVATVCDEIAVGIDRLRTMEALWESEKQRTRMQAQLEFAARMQSYLLPTSPPKASGFQIAASCLAAHEVGGDFYDWQELAPGVLNLTFGDVMGKGLAAAMLMATVKSALRALSQANSPLEALHLAEQSLHRDLERSESFVTLFHARLDTPSRSLAFVDCGHGLGFLRRAGGAVEELQPRCLPMGILTNSFQEGRLDFQSGDALVLYSDGLTDALPEQGRERRALAQKLEGATSAQEMVDTLVASVVADTQLPLADDLTVLVLRAD